MIFSIKTNLVKYPFLAARALQNAKTIILNHNIKVSETKLNDYLKSNYNMSLISACLYLLDHCKIQQNKSGDILIMFNSDKVNNLATLITYGNSEIRGSNILAEAFMRFEKG